MRKIILNISKLKLNFNALELILLELSYSSETDVDKSQIKNFFIRLLRRSLRNNIFVYFKRNLYILKEDVSFLLEHINNVILKEYSNITNVTTSNTHSFQVNSIIQLEEEELNLFKATLGEIIATELRKNKIILQPIYSKSSSIEAFRAHFTDEIEIKGPYELYPGFEYRIFSINNDFFIIIDLRVSTFSIKNLREFWDSDNNLQDNFLAGFETKFTDTCGLKLEECEHRSSPYSLCELGGKGKSININKFDLSLTPKSSEINLINYLEISERCYTGFFPKKIKNLPPIAIRTVSEEKTFHYPLERLRRIINLNDIKFDLGKDVSQEITAFFQPPNDQRLNKSKDYLEIFKLIKINQKKWIQFNNFLEFGKDHKDLYFMDTSELMIRFNKGNQFPTALGGLSRFGPFRSINNYNKTIKLLFMNFDEKTFSKLSYKIINYSPFKNRIKTYLKIFELKIVCENVKNQDELLSYSQNNKNFVLVCLIQMNNSFNKFDYRNLRKILIEKGIPTQGVYETTIKKLKLPTLTNILLGIFGKAGGQAWLTHITNEKKSKKLYIGIANSFNNEADTTIIRMSLFKESGEFIRLYWSSIDRFEYKEYLNTTLREIKANYLDHEIIIHRNGRIIEKGEVDIFDNLYKEGLINSVIEILHQSIIFRMYREDFNEKSNKILPVDKGYFLQLDKNQFILRTAEETPEEIQTETTIQVNFYKGNREIFINEIKNLIHLTTCFTGSTFYSTKLPVTLHNLSELPENSPETLENLPEFSNLLL